MNIGKKLITSFLGVSAITLLLGIVGYYGAVKSDEAIREIGINRMPSVESLLIMGDAQTTVDSAENALLSREISLKDRQSKYADFSIALKRADEAWKVYDPLPQMPEEKLVADKFYPAAWEAWKRDHDAFVELSKQYDKTLEGEQKGDTLARANDLYKKMSDQALVKNGITFDAANNLLDKLVELNHKYGADATKDALAQAATLKFLNLIVMVAGVATALLLGTVVSRGIVHPIRQAADMLKDISEGEGDLTKRLKVTTNDEIGEMATSFNKFVEKLQHVVVGIVANAKAVNLSVTELSTVSNQTAAAVTSMSEKTCTVATAAEEASANTVSVAASMEQTSTNLSSVAAATEEMSATVGEIATNSEKARVISSQATSQAESVSALMDSKEWVSALSWTARSWSQHSPGQQEVGLSALLDS